MTVTRVAATAVIKEQTHDLIAAKRVGTLGSARRRAGLASDRIILAYFFLYFAMKST